MLTLTLALPVDESFMTNRRSGLGSRLPGYSPLLPGHSPEFQLSLLQRTFLEPSVDGSGKVAVKWTPAAPLLLSLPSETVGNVASSTRMCLSFDLTVALVDAWHLMASPPGLALRLGKASRRSKSVHSRQPRG